MVCTIKLTDESLAKVDCEDLPRLVHRKWANHKGYAEATDSEQPRLMHRVIVGFVEVDHINGDRLDNRKSNLREASNSLNHANQPKFAGTYTSKYKGVGWKSGKWVARIKKDYQEIHLGRFDNEEDAARAYNDKAIELFGEFAFLNEVEEKN